MGLKDDLRKKAFSATQRVMERLMGDDRRAEQIAKVVGGVQRGKQVLSQTQDELLRALQVAPQSEYKALSKKLASLKRRVRELGEKLDTL
jgi:hypothetical protein